MEKSREILEKEIIGEVFGLGYGGMSGGDAYCEFRENYFDKLKDEEEREMAKDILLDFLDEKKEIVKDTLLKYFDEEYDLYCKHGDTKKKIAARDIALQFLHAKYGISDKLSDEEKNKIFRDHMLDYANEMYDIDFRARVAQVCASLKISGAKEKIEKLAREPSVAKSIYAKGINYALRQLSEPDESE